MARFFGAVGYNLGQVETTPGVWTDRIVERELFGDVKRDTLQARDGENVNGDLTVQNLIEVVADDYANENFQAIKYAVMDGVPWIVDSVETKRPRLILRLGRRYNGSRPPATP